MKENIMEAAYTFTHQFWKRSISQNMPQVKTLDRSEEFFNRLGISWLPSFAKGFYLKGTQIKIIHDPRSFYNLLLDKIKHSNNRIVLASLYLGTGSLERKIVDVINQRLFKNSNLTVKVLLDCMRGSRGENNSRKMFIPILENHKSSCQVSLYQTPVLKEPFLSILPERYKEIIALQHIKIYLFDNDIIISGANLSNDYFTNRQDRYMLIEECKELADFVEGLVEKVSECSFQLDSNNELHLHPNWQLNPIKSNTQLFINEVQKRIRNFYNDFTTRKPDDFDTVIFPLIEMGHYNINMDSAVTTRILEQTNDKVKAYLTTGYFNLTDSYTDSIINKSKAKFEVLMAHPTANGFFNSKGPSRGIPHAYTELAKEFLHKVQQSKQDHRVKMYEYVRSEWTYHAKGLWLSTQEKEEHTFLTMIGSPNFGERSIKRDLECQFLIATENEDLHRELLKEKQFLFSFAQAFTELTVKQDDRISPLWVKIVVMLFRNFL